MNIKNIKKIQSSSLWKKMLRNSYYRGHIMIDTYNKPEEQRKAGQFFVLLVFFKNNTKIKTLEKYLEEGRQMSKGEGLDCPEIYNFYGWINMLRFS